MQCIHSALLFYQFCSSARLSNAGTVSKRTDISSYFVDSLTGASFLFFMPHHRYKIPREPPQRGVKYNGVGKFLQILPFILETVRDKVYIYYGTLIESRR